MQKLELIRSEMMACRLCELTDSRKNIVFGVGNPNARIMIIGEGPGKDEDAEGYPFIGRAGKKLTRLMADVGLTREEVFITNIVKCRPVNLATGKDRRPTSNEVASCLPFLMRQIEAISPTVIVAVGNTATERILNVKPKMKSMHGQKFTLGKTPVIPIYHTSFIHTVKNGEQMIREDLKKVLTLVNEERQRGGGGSGTP